MSTTAPAPLRATMRRAEGTTPDEACTATRHGTALAYDRDQCRCPDAREAHRLYRKRLREGRQPAARVSSLGASRRLQGLVAEGHPVHFLAHQLNTSERNIHRWIARHTDRIHHSHHDAIAALARALANVPGTSRRARTLAHQHGWVPLAAWDDIDNPDETPTTRAARHAHDGRVLIRRVLNGTAPIDVLTATEQHRLWRQWTDERGHREQFCGSTSFARAFGISEERARRILSNQASPNDTAAYDRTDRKVA